MRVAVKDHNLFLEAHALALVFNDNNVLALCMLFCQLLIFKKKNVSQNIYLPKYISSKIRLECQQ